MKTFIFPSEFIDNKGGVAQSTLTLVRALSETENYRVVVLSPKNSEMSRTLFPDNVINITTSRSRWIMSKCSLFGTMFTVLDIYLSVKNYLDKNSWVITNQPVVSAIFSLLPCFNLNEIYVNRGGDFSDSGIASRIMRLKLKYQLPKCSIGISQRQVDLLVSSGMPKDKVFLIHNGIATPSVNYPITILNKDYLRISTVGYISDLKNQAEGVKLIKLLRESGVNAILNIYGVPDSDADYQKYINHLVKEYKLSSYINFCGYVTGENLYRSTDVLISFSKSEGFGRTLVEGMLRNKPIIAWKGAGGPVDITNNGMYGYLVENNKASEYLSVILSLLKYPEDCALNVKESYEFALKKFSIDSMIDNYLEVFRHTCK